MKQAGKRLTLTFILAAFGAIAHAQDVSDILDGGASAFRPEDVGFAIQILDAARSLETNQPGSISGAWPGIVVPDSDAAQLQSSYRALVPEIAIPPEMLDAEAARFISDIDSSGDLKDALNRDGIFAQAYDLARQRGDMGQLGSEEDAYMAYVRGLVVINSQFDGQFTLMTGRVPGDDKKCWWPFCPWSMAQ